MSIAQLWIESDLIIKILIITLASVIIMVLEKMYQYFIAYRDIKRLRQLKSLDELGSLKDGFMKETLKEIQAFKGSSESLFNSFVGVRLDMYEHYMMRSVTILGVIAILSPMLGLIGTFIGVWHVFEGVGSIGLNDPSMIARGIKEVIVDTMAGLVVAVIAMIFYKLFEYMSVKNVSIFEERLYRSLRGQDA